MKKNEIVKVLHYIPAFNYGGIEQLITDVNKNINKEKLVFYYLVEKEIPQKYKDVIEQSGGKIFIIPKISMKNFLKHIKALINVLKNNRDSILHCHYVTQKSPILLIAKILGIKRRILHSHVQHFPEYHYWIERLFAKFNIILATDYMACSEEATDRFGKKIAAKAKIIYNGIDIEKFKFNENNKNEILDKYNLTGKRVLAHVARFAEFKNQVFSVKVLNEINKINNENQYSLMFIGEGPYREEIEKKVNEYNLGDKVIFTGMQDNVKKYLDAIDIFLLPSFSEGLPISLIEAQANNVFCFISDNVTKIADFGKCKVLSINNTEKMWAEEIIKYFDEKSKYKLDLEKLKQFDIKNVTTEFEKVYLQGEL